eukprot:scaffold431_cov315-Prasinococcus_capsulatus_cf.AAC.15
MRRCRVRAGAACTAGPGARGVGRAHARASAESGQATDRGREAFTLAARLLHRARIPPTTTLTMDERTDGRAEVREAAARGGVAWIGRAGPGRKGDREVTHAGAGGGGLAVTGLRHSPSAHRERSRRDSETRLRSSTHLAHAATRASPAPARGDVASRMAPAAAAVTRCASHQSPAHRHRDDCRPAGEHGDDAARCARVHVPARARAAAPGAAAQGVDRRAACCCCCCSDHGRCWVGGRSRRESARRRCPRARAWLGPPAGAARALCARRRALPRGPCPCRPRSRTR